MCSDVRDALYKNNKFKWQYTTMYSWYNDRKYFYYGCKVITFKASSSFKGGDQNNSF